MCIWPRTYPPPPLLLQHPPAPSASLVRVSGTFSPTQAEDERERRQGVVVGSKRLLRGARAYISVLMPTGRGGGTSASAATERGPCSTPSLTSVLGCSGCLPLTLTSLAFPLPCARYMEAQCVHRAHISSPPLLSAFSSADLTVFLLRHACSVVSEVPMRLLPRHPIQLPAIVDFLSPSLPPRGFSQHAHVALA